jgi:hypothetical protein
MSMARFRLTQAAIVGQFRWPAGDTVADSQANAQAGDNVWVGLNSATMCEGVTPLDAAATSMRAASQWANVPLRNVIFGVDSISA